MNCTLNSSLRFGNQQPNTKLPMLQRLLLLLMIIPVTAIAQPPDPLLRRADDVQKMLNGTIPPDGLFSNAFLAQVPLPQVKEVVAQLRPAVGVIQHVALLRRIGPNSGTFTFTGSMGMKMEVDLSVDAAPPHSINGLLLKPPVPAGISKENISTLLEELRKLPGIVNFALMKLPERKIIASVHPEQPLAIASAFKLYILGELAAQAAEGKESWGNVIATDSSISGGGGRLASWPHGSPVTLHTLASLMISESDNAATDHLLRHLGRERVEQRVAAMGHTTPQRMIPFLATWEAFKLKSSQAGAERKKLASASESERRSAVASLGTLAIDYGGESGPLAIDTVEWFASASDLCRALDALRTTPDTHQAALSIMAINPGLSVDGAAWKYVGYKGGSEPGVLNLTFLLQAQSGEWYALSAGWNNPTAPLAEDQFLGLVQRILHTGPWR
ncbi:MAG: hypothetical protein DYG96_01410 [Chlorobi bacterium CHB2]|nr:hypothetical protein [Chlorobi bacterium CHB2]